MRFSYAIVALIGAAQAMPTVGSLITGRSVCNDASANCKGVARAVVADQAALDARKKSRQAKSDAANATAAAGGDSNNKRSKKLFQVEARANETASGAEARSLGEAVDGDVADTVGLKTRDGNEVRGAVADSAALEDRIKSRQAKSAAANATAEARSVNNKGRSANLVHGVGAEGALAKKQADNATADAGAEARKTRKSRRSRRSHQLW